MAERKCAVDGCDGIYGRPGTGRGFCSKHYNRLKRHGDPLGGGPSPRKTPADPLERFWYYVERVDGCWMWTGEILRNGYGRISVNRRRLLAHRFSYEHFKSRITDLLTIDHLCRNRACVNPDHLELVTRGENVLRGNTLPAANAAKTHCLRGHEFTPENTHVYRRQRYCRTCRRDKQRERMHRLRLERR